MNYSLPFIIEVKFPVSRKVKIILAIFLVFVELFFFALISLMSATVRDYSSAYYLVLLVPPFLYGYIFVLNLGQYSITLDESGISYADNYGKRFASYSDVVSIQSGFSNKNEYQANLGFVPKVQFNTAINLRNGGPMPIDAYRIGAEAMEKLINIVQSKNPAVNLDEYSKALKVGDIAPVQGAMKKGLLYTFGVILAVLLLEAILEAIIDYAGVHFFGLPCTARMLIC